MTLRYRCPWCTRRTQGLYAAKELRHHILERHRRFLMEGLGIIEAFTTRKEAIAP